MLKSLFTAIAVITVTAPVAQAVEFINKDGSKLSELCIVAAQNETVVNRIEASNVLCNNMNLKSFVKQYRNAETQSSIKAVTFEKANSTPESELCIAAATSNEAFAQAKVGFNKVTINSVACNGVELVKFAKRYNKSFNG
jgi:hypothetical protein